MSDISPFTGRRQSSAAPMRVLHSFIKPGGHCAEIRERKVTHFEAIEFIVFVDGSLLESQMFPGKRVESYPTELAARIKEFTDGGWQEDVTARVLPSA